MAKKDDKWAMFAAVIFGSIIIGGAIYLGFTNLNIGGGWGNFTWGGIAPLNPDHEFYQYDVLLRADKREICYGDYLFIEIISNIPNGMCTAFINKDNTGWVVLQSPIQLDANGYFAKAQQMNVAPGLYQGVAVCGDMKGNWRKSNLVTVTVLPSTDPQCDDGDDGNGGDGTDGDTHVCEGWWNPSESECAKGVCPDQSECCIYVPDSTLVPDHCECVEEDDSGNNDGSGGIIWDCNDYCTSLTNAGFNWGVCRSAFTAFGQPIREPCAPISAVHVSAGDAYCPFDDGSFTMMRQWCCCGQGI